MYREGYATYASTDATFTVDYPRTWEVQMGNRGTIEATFVNTPLKQTNGQNAYIHVAKGVLGSTTVEEAFNEAMGKYESLFKNMSVVSQDDVKIGWVPGKSVIFNGTLGGRTTGYGIVVFVKDGMTYVITASWPLGDYKLIQDELNTMIDSWKFNETPTNIVNDVPIEGNTQPTEEQLVEWPVVGDEIVETPIEENTQPTEQQPVNTTGAETPAVENPAN